jgi:hypothetical protein
VQVLDVIVSFITTHQVNGLSSAMRRAKHILRDRFPERFGVGSQATASQPGGSFPPPATGKRKAPESSIPSGSRSSGSFPKPPTKPRSGTPSVAAGSNAVEDKKKKSGRAAKPKLEKVPTHLDKTKSESKADRIQYQEDLLLRCAIQPDTITVDISALYPPVRDKSAELPP